jgi:hypothetical protein
MSSDEESGELQIGSSDWLESMRTKEEVMAEAKKNRPPTIHEHLNLDKTMKMERKRERVHPTNPSHKISGEPFSTVGEGSHGKNPSELIEK